MKIPTLRGYLSGDGMTITVFCPYCDAWHTHSSAFANGMNRRAKSHRVAHCFDDINGRGDLVPREGRKPTKATGYYVAEWRTKEARLLAHAIGQNTRQWFEALSTPPVKAQEAQKCVQVSRMVKR